VTLTIVSAIFTLTEMIDLQFMMVAMSQIIAALSAGVVPMDVVLKVTAAMSALSAAVAAKTIGTGVALSMMQALVAAVATRDVAKIMAAVAVIMTAIPK